MKLPFKTLLIVFIVTAVSRSAPLEASKSSRGAVVITRGQIEADWLRQREVRKTEPATSGKKVTVQQDAAGGCDGIKNGKWGFHTENEEKPWWQIDLGKSTQLERMVVYNRCELAERNSRLMVLVSDDAKNFRQPDKNPNGSIRNFKLRYGCEITCREGWKKEK